jgi:hypothetical protein
MCKLGRAAGIGLVVLSALVAVGVAALFLALLGPARTSPGRGQQSSGAARLIEYRTTEVRSTAAGIHTVPGGTSTAASGRADDSSRAIP